MACIYALRGKKDACLEALELSRECGSLPNTDDILNDVDMVGVKNATWFTHFIGVLTAVPESEVIDESVPVYDAEGNVINKTKKKTGFENEVDGMVYDAEGNVLNPVKEESSNVKSTDSSSAVVSNNEGSNVAKEGERNKVDN